MAINKWRYVEYTDDGCAAYQCLSCYEQWEGRTPPGWLDERGVLHKIWRLCPYCGTEWEGCINDGREDGRYGPRRTRIREAFNKRYEWGYRQHEPTFWWLIEQHVVGGFIREHQAKWEVSQRVAGFQLRPKQVLACARDHLQQVIADHSPPAYAGDNERREFYNHKCQVRVTKISAAEAKRKYPHGLPGYEVRRWRDD